MDDDLAGWWLLLVLLNACTIRRRREHLIGIRRHRSRIELQRCRQRRCRFDHERSRRRRAFLVSLLLLRKPENTRRLWNLPRTADLWEDANTFWDYDLWVSNMRMSGVTFLHRVEQVSPSLIRERTNMSDLLKTCESAHVL